MPRNYRALGMEGLRNPFKISLLVMILMGVESGIEVPRQFSIIESIIMVICFKGRMWWGDDRRY